MWISDFIFFLQFLRGKKSTVIENFFSSLWRPSGSYRINMYENKNYYMRTGSEAGWLAGFRALATAMDQLKRGKGHDPDRERTYDWSRQLGRFTAKKNEIQKSVPSFARGERKVALFTRSGRKWKSGSRMA